MILSQNMQKISNLNILKNGLAIKILYDNMKKLALFVFLHYFLISIFKKNAIVFGSFFDLNST